MNHPQDQLCRNCYNWVGPKHPGGDTGFCCVHPPIRLEPMEQDDGTKQSQSTFPTMKDSGWCAHWMEAAVIPTTPDKSKALAMPGNTDDAKPIKPDNTPIRAGIRRPTSL